MLTLSLSLLLIVRKWLSVLNECDSVDDSVETTLDDQIRLLDNVDMRRNHQGVYDAQGRICRKRKTDGLKKMIELMNKKKNY